MYENPKGLLQSYKNNTKTKVHSNLDIMKLDLVNFAIK